MRVFQILDGVSYADAVSNNVFEIKKFLDDLGVENMIFANGYDSRIKLEIKYFYEIANLREDDVVLFHYSGYSKLVETVKLMNCKKVFVYHNVTPYEFFEGLNLEVYKLCKSALDQIKSLKDYFDASVVMSEFSKSDLSKMGFKNVYVIPILLNFDLFDRIKVKKRLDSTFRFFFPGRIVPNKRQDDIIKFFYLYKKYVNEDSELIFTGSLTHTENYVKELKNLLNGLGLEKSVKFLGLVSDRELVEIFKTSDVLLSMSEHEGFCVPLLEAMYVGLPIFAFSSTAVKDTLSENHPALFENKDFANVLSIFESFNDLREEIIEFQNNRIKSFEKDKVVSMWQNLFDFLAKKCVKKNVLKQKSVSVVINTYERYPYLCDLLDKLSKQKYESFEVIVVNGPSTDDTKYIKNIYPNVKYFETKHRNLSVSRNVGINAASSDYVVFIDDDALPCDEHWISRFVNAFEKNQNLAAVGGPVKHRWTERYEFFKGYTNYYAEQIYNSEEVNEVNDDFFEGIPGGNVMFKMDFLLEVGGFDETFKYYLDETDVCARLSKKGYAVSNIKENYIRHFKANSNVRGNGYNLSWNIIAKSNIYYCLKNAKDNFFKRIILSIYNLRFKFMEIVSYWKQGYISFFAMVRYLFRFLRGAFLGFFLGIFRPRKLIKYKKNKDFVNLNHHEISNII